MPPKWDSLSKPERAKLLAGAGLPTGLAQLKWSGMQKSERKKLEKGKGWFEAKKTIMTNRGIEHKAPEHHRVAVKKEAGKALNKPMERKEGKTKTEQLMDSMYLAAKRREELQEEAKKSSYKTIGDELIEEVKESILNSIKGAKTLQELTEAVNRFIPDGISKEVEQAYKKKQGELERKEPITSKPKEEKLSERRYKEWYDKGFAEAGKKSSFYKDVKSVEDDIEMVKESNRTPAPEVYAGIPNLSGLESLAKLEGIKDGLIAKAKKAQEQKEACADSSGKEYAVAFLRKNPIPLSDIEYYKGRALNRHNPHAISDLVWQEAWKKVGMDGEIMILDSKGDIYLTPYYVDEVMVNRKYVKEGQPEEAMLKRMGEKEPWQMTKQEWLDANLSNKGQQSRKKQIGNITLKEWKLREHRNHVEQATRDHKPVPEKVLAEYPELIKKEEQKEPEPQWKCPWCGGQFWLVGDLNKHECPNRPKDLTLEEKKFVDGLIKQASEGATIKEFGTRLYVWRGDEPYATKHITDSEYAALKAIINGVHQVSRADALKNLKEGREKEAKIAKEIKERKEQPSTRVEDVIARQLESKSTPIPEKELVALQESARERLKAKGMLETPPTQEVKDWMKKAHGIQDYKGVRSDRIGMLRYIIYQGTIGNLRDRNEVLSVAEALGNDLGYGTPPSYGISTERYYAEKIAAETGKDIPIIKGSSIVKPPLIQSPVEKLLHPIKPETIKEELNPTGDSKLDKLLKSTAWRFRSSETSIKGKRVESRKQDAIQYAVALYNFILQGGVEPSPPDHFTQYESRDVFRMAGNAIHGRNILQGVD